MSTENKVYIGTVLNFKKILGKTQYKDVCSYNKNHLVIPNKSFCPECGNPITEIKLPTVAEYPNLYKYMNGTEFEDLLYAGSDYSFGSWMINEKIGNRLFSIYDYDMIDLDESFFKKLMDEYNSHNRLHEFIEFIKKELGEDCLEIKHRKLVLYTY